MSGFFARPRKGTRPVPVPAGREPEHGIPLLRDVTLQCTGARLVQGVDTLTIRWSSGGELVVPMTRCVHADVLHTGEPGTLQLVCRLSLPVGDRGRADVVTFRLSVPAEQRDLAYEVVWRLRDLGPPRDPRSAGEPGPAGVPSAFGAGGGDPVAPVPDPWPGTRTGETDPTWPEDVTTGRAASGAPLSFDGDGDARDGEPPGVHLVTVPDTDDWISFRPTAETEGLTGRLPRRPPHAQGYGRR